MRFVGFGLEDKVPDAKTVWLYREQLARAGMVEALFEDFDGYLEKQGYLAMGGQIIDASIVPVPKQRNSRDDNARIKDGETPEGWKDQPAKRSQKDTDARWTTDAAVHDSQVGRGPTILLKRERIKRQTIEHRRLQYRKTAA